VAGRWRRLLRGIAVVAFLLGIVGSLARGFWATSHGYQLVHNDWQAKDRGCEARTPSGDEVLHSEALASKATDWVWQFAIFAVGTLPAIGMTVSVGRHPGGTDA
jgi:hypothetical protein